MSRHSPLEIIDDDEENIVCTATSTKALPAASQLTFRRQTSRPTAAQRIRNAASCAAAAAAAASVEDGVLPMDQSDGASVSAASSDAFSSFPVSAAFSHIAASASSSEVNESRHLLKQAAADRAARVNKIQSAAAASSKFAAAANMQAGPPPRAAAAASSSAVLPMPDATDEDEDEGEDKNRQSMEDDAEAFVFEELPLDTRGDEELARLLQLQESAAASRISTPSPRRNSVSPQRRLSEFRTIDPDYVSSGRCLGIPPTLGDEVGFFFNRVHGQLNRCAMRLSMIISGDVQRAVLFNYCIGLSHHKFLLTSRSPPAEAAENHTVTRLLCSFLTRFRAHGLLIRYGLDV